jgi:hypothetical protein
LNLPATLRGSFVACPTCGQEFTAPGRPDPGTPPVMAAVQVPTREPAPIPLEPVSLIASLDAAAAWLKWALGLHALTVVSWWSCCAPVAEEIWPLGMSWLYLVLPLGGVLGLGIAFAGVRAFLGLSSYGGALIGLLALLFLSGLALLETSLMALLYSGAISQWLGTTRHGGICFEMFLLGLPGTAGVVGLIACSRSLLLLHHPEVALEFRRRAGGARK